MAFDIEGLKQRAKDYVELEAGTEVKSVEYANTFAVFGEEDVVLSVSTTDEEDPDWWVVTGSTPMNLYSKNRFRSDDEAYSFHTGLMVRMQSSGREKAQAESQGFNILICFLAEDYVGEDFLLGNTLVHTIYYLSESEGIGYGVIEYLNC